MEVSNSSRMAVPVMAMGQLANEATSPTQREPVSIPINPPEKVRRTASVKIE